MNLKDIITPAAIIDAERMRENIGQMQRHIDGLGVSFRPHVKTSKCARVVEAQIKAGAKGITVSTLKEAEFFHQQGITDITYAVGIVQSKLPVAGELINKSCDLKIMTDNPETGRAIAEYGKSNNIPFKVLLEIDTDGHRSGLAPDSPELTAIAETITKGGSVVEGVLTHAGSSYGLSDAAALRSLAEQERAGCLAAAALLRKAGHACPTVSVGSTPTALSARNLDGVTEVRAGVYVFFDLVMHSVGVCAADQIALSVLTTVIGHQKEKGWTIVDAGWMAMSRDQGTSGRRTDYGYGQVCDVNGIPVPGYIVAGANQEHGIITRRDTRDNSAAECFPVGTLLRILPVHACATAAQFPGYHVLSKDASIAVWPRFYGW